MIIVLTVYCSNCGISANIKLTLLYLNMITALKKKSVLLYHVQSNLDYPDLDYPDFSIIWTFSLVPVWS